MAEGVSSSTIEFFCSFVFGRFRTHPLLNCGGCSSGLPSFFCVSLLAILRCHSWFQWIGLGFGFYFAIKILLALVFCLFFCRMGGLDCILRVFFFFGRALLDENNGTCGEYCAFFHLIFLPPVRFVFVAVLFAMVSLDISGTAFLLDRNRFFCCFFRRFLSEESFATRKMNRSENEIRRYREAGAG